MKNNNLHNFNVEIESSPIKNILKIKMNKEI